MIIEPKHHQGIVPFFVYGTLLLGEGNDRRWHDLVDRVEQNLVVAGYQLAVNHIEGYIASFPYAVSDSDPDHYVMGDLLWPNSDESAGKMTEDFDRLEGHPHHYVRTSVKVLRNAHETVESWMYVLARPEIWESRMKKIGSSWREYLKREQQLGQRSWDMQTYAGI